MKIDDRVPQRWIVQPSADARDELESKVMKFFEGVGGKFHNPDDWEPFVSAVEKVGNDGGYIVIRWADDYGKPSEEPIDQWWLMKEDDFDDAREKYGIQIPNEKKASA